MYFGLRGRSQTDNILVFFKHLPTPSWQKWRNSITVIRENLHIVDIFSTCTYLPHLVNIVCERPLKRLYLLYLVHSNNQFTCKPGCVHVFLIFLPSKLLLVRKTWMTNVSNSHHHSDSNWVKCDGNCLTP